ncbi:MAG: hypothetical protein K9K78_01000, partial [Spirochaetales bacterium]|nr:hypothetical protein [Spirochaetales bacterium]
DGEEKPEGIGLLLLSGSHDALAVEVGVGDVVDEAGFADSEVDVVGMVLGEDEGFEAVDDEDLVKYTFFLVKSPNCHYDFCISTSSTAIHDGRI